ncbi:hypothetical protein TNCV_3462261 [Trichonephila clavipes]|nr:hypothetical protein TNCV_3462261 [Trichonephila clavipes]
MYSNVSRTQGACQVKRLLANRARPRSAWKVIELVVQLQRLWDDLLQTVIGDLNRCHAVFRLSYFKAALGLLVTDLITLNQSQVMKPTPELATSPNYPITPSGGLSASTDLRCVSHST